MVNLSRDEWAKDASEFYNRNAPSKKSTVYRKVFTRAYQSLIARIPELQNKTVLDLGCGPAFLHDALLPVRTKVIGVDISHESLKAAHAANADANLLEADFTSLPIESGSMDYVIALTSLEFCKDKTSALREINRVLHARGQLYMEVRNAGFLVTCLPAALRNLLTSTGLLKPYPAEGFHDLNSDEWVKLLSGCRFSVNATYRSLRPWNFGTPLARFKNLLIYIGKFLLPWNRQYMVGLLLTKD